MTEPDFVWKAGNTTPFVYKIDDYPQNFEGAAISFTMRSPIAALTTPVDGQVEITDVAGEFQFTPTASDTALPGGYMATFDLTLENGTQVTYPTDGYLWLQIEPSAAALSQQLVGLPHVHMNLPSTARVSDMKLLGWISTATILIEALVGPVIFRQFEEWHDGGGTYITLRRRPSRAIGANPLVTLQACSEYNGPIEWPLAVVATPEKGGIYSCMLDAGRGRVIRRSAGGGVQPFPGPLPNSVHVIYSAGQAVVPDNIQEAALETVRVYYETTQAVGRGARTRSDELDTGPQIAMVLPPSARRLLSPMRRHPSLA